MIGHLCGLIAVPCPRLHKSSFVVAGVAAVWLILVNVPGRVTEWRPATFYRYEHGWPWVYLQRETLDEANGVSSWRREYLYRRDAMQSLPGLGVPWLRAANWKFWEAVSNRESWGWRPREGWRWNWNGRTLFANGAIAMAVLVGSVAAWEWRRRRRNSWIRFSLAEILLVVTSLSAVLGWLVHMERDSQHESRVEEWFILETDSGCYVDDYTCIAPVWVRSLIGEKLLPEFTWRVAKVNLDTDAVAESPGKILQEISKLSYIQTVSVDGSFEESPHFPFGKLRVLNRLRTLEVTFSRPLDQPDVDELSQLVGLKVLALWDISVELPAILARLRTKLPGCRIVTMYEDEISRTFP